MSDVDAIATVLIDAACRRIVVATARCNDAKQWDELGDLYTVDATLQRPNGQVLTGRAEIVDSYRSGPPERRTRHVCSNIDIEVLDAGSAVGVTSVLVYSWHDGDGDGLPLATGPVIGDFRDRFTLTADGWSIAARTASLAARL